MQILDYNHGIDAREHHKLSDDGGGCIGFGRPARPPATAQTSGAETRLKAGFNQHSVLLPNGVKVNLSEDGRISIEEKNAPPKKIRHKDRVEQHLIK